jgi:hypothetical protein
MPTDNTSVTSTAADRLAGILVTVSQDRRPGRYQARLGEQQELLCVSRQPFLDSARRLLGRGQEPRTLLVMRWTGSKDWALRAPLEVAAKLTVDEHNGAFSKWKPLSRSAVPPGNANSVRKVPKGRIAEKAIPKSTAEKAGERASLAHPAPSAARERSNNYGCRPLSKQRLAAVVGQ